VSRSQSSTWSIFFHMLGLFWPIIFQSGSSPCRVESNSKSIGSVRRFVSPAFEMVCALGLFIRQKLITDFPYMISAAHTICHSYHPESITCTEIALDVSNVKSTINKGGNTRSILLDHRGRQLGCHWHEQTQVNIRLRCEYSKPLIQLSRRP